MFNLLPDDVKLGICKLLPLGALPKFSETSKELYELINLDAFCQRKFLHDFAIDTTLLEGNNYKKFKKLTEIAIDQAKSNDFIGAKRTFVLAEEAYTAATGSPAKDFYFNFEEDDNESSKLVLTKIITTLIEAGDIEGAKTIDLPEEDHRSRSIVLKEFANSLVKMGQTEEADKLFTLSEQEALLVKSELHKSQLLRKIATALVETGRKEKASTLFASSEEVALQIENDNDRSLELAKLATALAKTGQKEKADTLFALSEKTALQIKKDAKKSSALIKIAQQHVQTGNIEEAKAISSLITDFRQRSILLKKIIEFQLKAAKAFAKASLEEANKLFTLAEETALSIKSGLDKSLALTKVAAALAEIGQKEESHRLCVLSKDAVLSMNGGGYQKCVALTKIAVILAEIDKKEESEKLCTSSQALTPSMKIISFKSMALTKIAVALAKIDQKEQASKLLDSSMNIALGDSNPTGKSKALTKIARAQSKIARDLVKSGDIAGVKEFIGNVKKMDFSDIDVASIALQAAQEMNITL